MQSSNESRFDISPKAGQSVFDMVSQIEDSVNKVSKAADQVSPTTKRSFIEDNSQIEERDAKYLKSAEFLKGSVKHLKKATDSNNGSASQCEAIDNPQIEAIQKLKQSINDIKTEASVSSSKVVNVKPTHDPSGGEEKLIANFIANVKKNSSNNAFLRTLYYASTIPQEVESEEDLKSKWGPEAGS